MKYQRVLVIAVVAIVIIYLVKYIMKCRESIYNTDVFNKMLEERPIYTKNNKLVEQFFNDIKEYNSKENPADIVSEDQRQRRMLAIPMGMKESPLNNN
jgi:hypothetical protein